ncbi:MAG: acetyl-coenzyme A synthetase, partial [Candidatus Aenigmarchaeota archaeon]|nr:acetyl-coenzyme A synthetase [Candidatus Aenigmarchaeota archaeon]
HKKYVSTYWSQYGNKVYLTSDFAYKDKNGLIRVVGRADDIIKVAGHRLSTGELENIFSHNKKVSEVAVIGVAHEIKGEVPIAFIVLKTGKPDDKIKVELVKQVERDIGKIARPSQIYFVEGLPKTRSGKIMRRILRKLFTGEELGDLSTLANPESVKKLKEVIKKN